MNNENRKRKNIFTVLYNDDSEEEGQNITPAVNSNPTINKKQKIIKKIKKQLTIKIYDK